MAVSTIPVAWRSRVAATGSPVAAAVALVTAWSAALVSLVLWAVNRPPLGIETWFFAVDVTVAVVYGGVGALVLARRRHAVAWIFVVAAVGGGLAALGSQYAARAAAVGGLPGDRFVGSMVGWAWVPGTLALVTVVPWLVRDDRLPRWAWAFVGAGAVVSVGVMVLRMTDPYPWPDAEPRMPLAVRSVAWGRFVEDALPWLFLVVVLLGAAATADVAVRVRRARGTSSTGLAWLLVGSAVMTISFVPLALPTGWFEGSVAVPTLTPVSHLVSQAFLPAATIVVVLRQRLWGIDLALNRTLVRALLSAALVGVYAVIVVSAQELLPGTGAPAALGAAAVAALVLPLRTSVQRRVDRLVLGAAAEPGRAVSGLTDVLGRGGSADGLVAGVAEHLARSLRLGAVHVVAHGAPGRVLARAGEIDGPVQRVGLVLGEDPVGHLEVAAPFGERLDTRTLAALDDVAPIVAAIVALVTLNDELERTSERLTEARVEERRVLRRDLHDGLGPALAGIGLGLQAYRNLRAVDAAAADRLLERLCEEVDQRVEDVRQLSRQLLPPVLDELGLVAAVRELAERHAAGGTHVEVDAPDHLDVPADVAAAAYAVVAEALVNATRHGAASSAWVVVEPGVDTLAVTVTNDGTPIDPAAVPGIGLRSMRERTDALHGAFAVGVDTAGRTSVRASFPVGGRRRYEAGVVAGTGTEVRTGIGTEMGAAGR